MSEQKPIEQTPVAEAENSQEVVESADKPSETPAATADPNGTEAGTNTEEPAKDELVNTEETAKAEPAATASPEQETKSEEQKPQKPAYLTSIPSLSEFFDHLPAILSKTGHDEMWGVLLKDSEDIPTVNVLIKFLRANEGNLQAAEDQLSKALEWRKETNPLALVESGQYPASKYEGLGYLTIYAQDGHPLVFTWNIYGAVKDMSATFGDSDELVTVSIPNNEHLSNMTRFVKWRAALMELAVQELKMKDATTVIDYDGENDPYQMIQVHDYLNVKFFRMDPAVRAATKKTIDVFSTAYPELLREKFFVNVPAIMGWMFSAMKLILSKNTTRKFHPITNGVNLAREFPVAIAEKIPKAYGGKGLELKDEARSIKLVEDKVEKKDEQKNEQKDDTKPADVSDQNAAAGVPVKTEELTEAPKEDAAAAEPAKETAKDDSKEESK
ncbi:hypothetical protein N7532_006606 [Penicillium argentinense]|uniref:Phosphatidylinositol transfer protein SFH5 n=1 Tax=Penicillium argentinense TaxID=1131581 RepID=A0A9W9FG45_9EURO|nr:uncharacterized protein N7532_006606 [Penicillium argentinense]KAJ5099605.1 hypothetical protein N7532_006606 [Penicillium argentinense]